jgi:hypothetical protein
MDTFTVFPNAVVKAAGPVSDKFLSLGINGKTPVSDCLLVTNYD